MSYVSLTLSIASGIVIADAVRRGVELMMLYWALRRSAQRQAQYQAGAKDFARAVEMAHAEKKLHLLSQSDKLTVQ